MRRASLDEKPKYVHMHGMASDVCTCFGMEAMQTDMQHDDKTAEPAICNCLALRQAARHTTQLYDRHLGSEGLRTTQYSILSKLARLGPQTINALAAMMVMDRTTTTRAVGPLARDKLVSIEAGEDARPRVVRLTLAGEKRRKA